MKIGECILGIPVARVVALQAGAFPDYGKAQAVGHITGFDLNPSGEVVVKVKWAEGHESSIHASNIFRLDQLDLQAVSIYQEWKCNWDAPNGKEVDPTFKISYRD